MDMATIVQNKVIIMFIMVLIGLVCAKVGLIDAATNKKLSNITMMLVSPLLMFASFQLDFSAEMLRNLLLSFVLSIVCFAVAIAMSYLLIRGKDHSRVSIERISMIYSNCGFIGIPLAESRIIAIMHRDGKVLSTEYEGNDALVEAILPREFAARLESYLV
jgi:predicted permease